MVRNFFLSSIVAATVLSSGGCGVEERYAPRDQVRPPDLQRFALSTPDERSQVLMNNKMFFWRTDVTAEQAEMVLRQARIIESTEDAVYQIRVAAPQDPEEKRRYDEAHEEELNRYGQLAEEAIYRIMENADYFTDQPTMVSFRVNETGLHVTLQQWERQTFSTDGQNDSAQRVRDVSYEPTGGVWRFRVYGGPTSFGTGDYYEFRMGRSHPEINDGRIFYQGDMTLVRGGVVVRRGVVKLASQRT